MADEQPTPLEIRVFDKITVSDDDLGRIHASVSEDHFVERKSFGDWHKDALKTVVAFANSTPVGLPAYLFIGVKNDGQVEDKSNDMNSIQKKLAERLKPAYPPIYYVPKVLQERDRQYLAVIVYGSENRPHFAGRSYVREGSQTKEASEPQLREFIAQRQSKVYELLKWKGKTVTAENVHGSGIQQFRSSFYPTVLDCNEFYVTLGNPSPSSFALRIIDLNFDHPNNRLKIEIYR